MMKALVYHGLGKKAWEEHANPTVIDPTDAIVRVTKTTICGTDLHILASLVKMIEAVRRFGAAA